MRQLSVVAVLLASTPALAMDLTDFELRFSFFDQYGRGYQSPAGPRSGPGSEQAAVYQPQLRGRFRDGSWTHDGVISVNIVSNASTDALDAISTASAVNESVGFDVVSSHEGADGGRVSARYGFHLEEPLQSGFAGLGYLRKLADDNATVGVTGLVILDSVDQVPFTGGENYGKDTRWTFNVNLSGSQILSPTTVIDGGYGLTAQTGRLATSYNSVPLDDGQRGGEVFDGSRLRHALRVHLAQHIPATRSTAQASYRFYVDNYGLTAHTVNVHAYQYLVPWLYLRGSYRLHHQSGVDFFATTFAPMEVPTPRTSDSDLAPFDAHEVGLKLHLLGERSPMDELAHVVFELALYRYWRSNDMIVNWLGFAVGYRY